MKLDSIIYDYSTLQNAISSELNSEATTFKAIYPSDTATSLVNTLASYGAMLQYQLVSAMANCYTDSAYSEAGIRQLAETLGNRLHGNMSSHVYCTITRTSLTGVDNVVIPAGSKFTIKELNFFNAEAILFTRAINKITDIKLIQGTWQTSEQVSAGISGEKLYFCDNFKCDTNNVEVYVNGEKWKTVDSFLPYVIIDTTIQAEAKVVILKTDPDGRTHIKFGNNTNGIIPSAGSTITINYVDNEGAAGNITDTDIDITFNTPIYYINNGVRERLTIDAVATSTISGGFDTQSIETLRQSSPYVFGSGQRAIRRDDYKSMLLNQCGYLTANVWGEYEEASLYGGYDKIMMNMVYYSGIKSIQKYDLQPMKTLQISMTQVDTDTSGFYPISASISGARGFLGSYIIDIKSYTDEGAEQTVKYRDRQGTGILTCDPSMNESLDNFERDIYPLNEFISDSTVTLNTNQRYVTASGDPASANPLLLKTGPSGGNAYTSTGLTASGQPHIITFDNPFQITFDYTNRTAITNIAFKIPESTSRVKQFIKQFALYGTNEINRSYLNVKNNSTWTRLIDIQSFSEEVTLGAWSDWFTTNLYKPGTAVTETEDVTSTRSAQATYTDYTITTLIGTDYTYVVKVDGAALSKTAYGIINDGATLRIYSVIPTTSTVLIEGTLSDWLKYKYYVLEVYSLQDGTSSARKVSIDQIKLIYKNSASTIYYNNNNLTTINLPILKVHNLVEAKVAEGQLPESSTWLSAITTGEPVCDPTKLYHINDDYEEGITGIITKEDVSIATAGSGYAIGDELYFTKTPTGSSTPYPSKLTLKITAVTTSPAGGVSDFEITTPGGIITWDANAGGVAPSTSGTGTGATFDIICMRTMIYDNTRYVYSASTTKYQQVPANIKRLALPDTMQYYEYTVTTEGITEVNGYKTNDVLTYSFVNEKYTYTFTLIVNNIISQDITAMIKIDNNPISTILRGKTNIILDKVSLFEGSGSGATLTVSSTPTLKVYGSYMGNFYSDKDTQAADLPIINKYNHFTTYLEFKQPHIKTISIELNLEYEDTSTYQTVRNRVINAINALFEITPYSIGKTLNISDIWKAINEVAGVKRFVVLTPIGNIDCMPYEIINLPAENLIIHDILTNEY